MTEAKFNHDMQDRALDRPLDYEPGSMLVRVLHQAKIVMIRVLLPPGVPGSGLFTAQADRYFVAR